MDLPIKPLVKLENWAYAMLKRIPRLGGQAYGHPRYPDRTHVWTSRIHRVNGVAFADGEHILGPGAIVETHNTAYILGEPEDA